MGRSFVGALLLGGDICETHSNLRYPKSQATRAAERFFKERGVTVHFVDLTIKPMAPGEIRRFIEKFTLRGLLDKQGKAYVASGLQYINHTDAGLLEKIAASPDLLKLRSFAAETGSASARIPWRGRRCWPPETGFPWWRVTLRPMNRRAFLSSLSLAFADVLPGQETPRSPENPFRLGVASGDPAPDGFVLWTRLISPVLQKPVPVRWVVATDERCTKSSVKAPPWPLQNSPIPCTWNWKG